MSDESKLLPVILSGGVGSRLWPLSRQTHPKPFIKLPDGESLIQKTFRRATDLSSNRELVVVTNKDLFFSCREEFDLFNNTEAITTYILEPCGRDSTAAIALAAHYAIDKYGDDCTLLVLPADHLIADQVAFLDAVDQAKILANLGRLVTFGIKPSRPDTGYGYILAEGGKVKKFVEKPILSKALEYVANGNYYWNAGIFCMNAGEFISSLVTADAAIASQTSSALANASYNSDENWNKIEIQYGDFNFIKKISVDYAVFETSENVAMVPCDIGWTDIGSWNELGSLYASDESKNNIVGDTISKFTQNCTIFGGDRLIATVGISDLIISDTQDALLVAHKDSAQDVRSIFDELKKENHPAHLEFKTVRRPWGAYTVLLDAPGFKVKKIEVKSGGKLSLQSHNYRSEHWVVVQGTAVVSNGEEMKELNKDQSIYIEKFKKHRIHNPCSETLIIVEVQCGDYLEEDDIVRYDDVYGRID